MNYSAFLTPPSDFQAKVEASGCYCEFEGKLLFVKRMPGKPQGGTWGVPGGKLEEKEDARQAVIREIREEIGLNIDSPELSAVGKLYMRLPHIDYVFNMFRIPLKTFPTLELEIAEHEEFKWVTIEEALALPLISGGKEALELYKKAR